jgi:hypothetical protein
MGEWRRLGTTRSGYAKLIELDDADARSPELDSWLVAQFAYGLGPVEVVRVKSGIAGEPGYAFEVPVIEARIPTGQVLSFAPEELCRVRESKGGRS